MGEAKKPLPVLVRAAMRRQDTRMMEFFGSFFKKERAFPFYGSVEEHHG
jgi:hypothetical protein